MVYIYIQYTYACIPCMHMHACIGTYTCYTEIIPCSSKSMHVTQTLDLKISDYTGLQCIRYDVIHNFCCHSLVIEFVGVRDCKVVACS